MPGVLTDYQRKRAAQDLGLQGIDATNTNIAVQAAEKDYPEKDPSAPSAAARDLGVGGPKSEIADRLTREAEIKRRQGPPEEMLRRQRRGM